MSNVFHQTINVYIQYYWMSPLYNRFFFQNIFVTKVENKIK